MIYRGAETPHSAADLIGDRRLKALAARLGDTSAPTAVRALEDVKRVHLADSLMGLKVPAVRGAAVLIMP